MRPGSFFRILKQKTRAGKAPVRVLAVWVRDGAVASQVRGHQDAARNRLLTFSQLIMSKKALM